MIWKITVIVTFASNILSFYSISSQFALKIWEYIFLSDSKKAWFDDLIARCFQYREFDFVQLTILDLMIDN